MFKHLVNWLSAYFERRRFQSMMELKENYLYHKVLKNQLDIAKLTLREIRREECLDKQIRERKPRGYIC